MKKKIIIISKHKINAKNAMIVGCGYKDELKYR